MLIEPTRSERVAVSRLHALLELLPTALDQRLRPVGMTTFEFIVLEKLSEAEGTRLRMSEIAAKTNATLPRLSRVANSLEKQDLVCRSRCAEDARATNLELTPQGIAAFSRARPLYYGAVRELVLDGVNAIPGDGIGLLADLAYAILTTLDSAHAADGPRRSADPVAPACDADPVAPACDADPAPSRAVELPA